MELRETDSAAVGIELVGVCEQSSGDSEQTQQDQALRAALVYLASVCDGAVSKDEHGFNAYDAEWGQRMAAHLRLSPDRPLTDMERKALHQRLARYQGQLERAGLELPRPEPEPQAAQTHDRVVLGGNGAIWIYFAAASTFRALLDATRSLSNRKFIGGPDPHWEAPREIAAEVVRTMAGQPITVSDEIKALAELQPDPVTAAPKRPVGRAVSLGSDDNLIISFPYDPEMVALVKRLSSRRFDPKSKRWEAPLRVAGEVIEMLSPHGFRIADEVASLAQQHAELGDLSRAMDAELPPIQGLGGELLPFQRAGVAYIERIGGRAIVGDEMGLGKTPEALAYLQLHPELRPAVLVVPASIKIHWARHIDRWLSEGKRRAVLEGRTPQPELLTDIDIAIVNYDILSGWADTLREWGYKIIIFDEAHYLKTMQFGKNGVKKSSLRAAAAYVLVQGCEKVLFLTGTPAMNKPAELFPLLHMTDPAAWPDFFSFAIRYCGGFRDSNGYWQFGGASNLDELSDKVRAVMIRRLKRDVLKELPPKRRATVIVPLDNRREYEAILHDTAEWLYENPGSNANHLAKIEQLKQAALRGKLSSAIAWIRDQIANGEKLVVFAHHKFAIEALMDAFGDQAVKLTGETSQADRQTAVDRFQNDPSVRLFVGNILAAGVGITLTAASNVAFLELMWRPGDHSQAEDRIYRIGQEATSVTAWYLLAEETIDEDICELLEGKRQVLEMALDGAEGDLQFGILQDVIKRVKREAPPKTGKGSAHDDNL